MTWFKVDDSFYDHPKVFDAPDCAVALWTRAGTWAARNLTNGFVPSGMPARLCDDPDTAVKELVRRGLWTRASGGYKFHDWSSYQPSPESVEALRAKRAAAGSKGGKAKAARMAGSSRSANSSHSAGRPTIRNTLSTGSAGPVEAGIATGQDDSAKQNASKALANARPVAKQNAAPSRPPSLKGGEGRSVEGGGRGAAANLSPPGQCRNHRGQPAGNCAMCRSERLGGTGD